MSQIPLPFEDCSEGARRIVIGNGNEAAIEGLQHADTWPFRTAILSGPPRSGKSALAQWFAQSGKGRVVDDAHTQPEAQVFHAWNAAQECGAPLLLVVSDAPWTIDLPDLRSRVGAALWLELSLPDDEMMGALLEEFAARRGLVLAEGVTKFLVPRMMRSYAAIARLIDRIDHLSLARKAPVGLNLCREALESYLLA